MHESKRNRTILTFVYSILTVLIIASRAHGDTPPPTVGNFNLRDGAGNPITSTVGSSKRALDFHLIDTSVAITASSLPLPSGASTETSLLGVQTRLDSSLTKLDSIISKLPTLVGGATPVTGSFYQATQPVSIASNVPVTGTFWQATQPVSGPLTDSQLRASAVPISAATLPLPTGAATSSNQSAANSSLSSIDSKLSSTAGALNVNVVSGGGGGGSSGGLTNTELRASAVPVSGPLTDSQLRATAVPVSGSVTATISGTPSVSVSNFPATQAVSGTVAVSNQPTTMAVTQATGSNLHTVVDSGAVTATISGTPNVNVTNSSIAVTGPLTDSQLRATAVPVSNASLPLPAGASTSALQTSGNSSLTSIDSKLSGTLNVSAAQPPDYSGFGTIAANGGAVTLTSLNSVADATFVVTGTWVGGLNAQGSVDGSTWDNLTMFVPSLGTAWATTAVSGNGNVRVAGLAGYKQFRVVASSWTSGSASVTVNATSGANIVNVKQSNAANLKVTSNTADGSGNAIGSTSGALNVAVTSQPTATYEYLGSGTITGAGVVAGTSILTRGLGSAGIYVDGTWSGLIALQGRVAGSTAWQAIPIYDYGSRTSQIYVSTAANATAKIGGFQEVRLNAVTWSSGTGYPFIGLNNGDSPAPVTSSDPGGFYATANMRDGSSNALTSTSGALDVNLKSGASGLATAANQATELSYLARLPVSGPATPANSQPVVLASDLTVSGGALQTLNTDLISGTTGWYDAGNFHSAAVQIVAPAGVTGGAVIFEQTNDVNNAGVVWPVFESALLTSDPITSATSITASTVRIFEGPVTARYVRARIQTAFTGAAVTAYGVFSQQPYAATRLTMRQGTAANLNATVSGSLTTVSTVSTVSAVTAANLAASAVTDIGSAAITTTATSAGIAQTNVQSASFGVIVTAASGTTPTLDVVVQETYDGTNWFDVYHFERITAAGQYYSPAIRLTGQQVRYVRTVAGTTPSFTMSLVRNARQISAPYYRRIFDRAISPNTLNSTSATLQAEGCDEIQLTQSSGAGATVNPVYTLEGSEDGAAWYAIGSATISAAPSTTATTFANHIMKFARARVSTAGTGATHNYLVLKCRGA